MGKEYNVSVTHNLYRELQDSNLEGSIRHYFLPTITDEVYDEIGYKHSQQLIKDYKEKTGNKRLGTVLEYGCGDGRIAQFMAENCNRMICLDVSKAVLKKAKEKLDGLAMENSEFVIADDYKEVDVADFIYCIQVIQHNTQEEQLEIMKRIQELLKPDGVACLHFSKIESKPNYANHDTCMCFTRTEVELLVSDFSEYDIRDEVFADHLAGYGSIEDYFVWVKK